MRRRLLWCSRITVCYVVLPRVPRGHMLHSFPHPQKEIEDNKTEERYHQCKSHQFLMVPSVHVFATKRVAEVILVALVDDGAALTKTNAVQSTVDQTMLLTE